LEACTLAEGRWYELGFRSAILYGGIPSLSATGAAGGGGRSRERWANHSTTFVFKAEPAVLERNGTELGWLQRLLHITIKYSAE
jgi:hypothetical protein